VDQIDLTVDVTEAVSLGERATVALTVHLPAPEDLGSPPVVCFAKPGAGFSRAYFTSDLPGPGSGSQADWHATRGWVFVSVDHLGSGRSSTHHDPARLDYPTLAAASQAAEQAVLEWLRQGSLRNGFAPVQEPVLLGIGQSMGGCLTVVQQGHYHCYDGIAVLGFSAVRTDRPVPPGQAPFVMPWHLRGTPAGSPPVVLNPARVAASATLGSSDYISSTSWLFFYDDVDATRLRTSLPGISPGAAAPPWVSTTFPGVVASVLTPGVIASEAAAVEAPVLVAMGERDVVPDPKGEPRAYLSAASVDLYVCPRMAHMHNFAGTRDLLWQRIETWAAWVCAAKSYPGGDALRP
jgi:alpha-beta hydrolase superfamily lysophospholipase